ncbi:CsgG/HfaB family protein [Herbaspirillum sp. ST 5-3]|uniref:CsgG/HfaB family protein n=1 Tax=Oxalobacteraceae TaxID=75682 RepID=UPI001FFE7317|nr:CsgG/HfaB family protein [Herbaspirillum sp. ST 5-3]
MSAARGRRAMRQESAGTAMQRGIAGSLLFAGLLLSGCASTQVPAEVAPTAQLTPVTAITRDLMKLPKPKGKIVVAVYGFRDQTGQYKPSPDSSFSTSVTQGAASLLIKALKDSGWFKPVERENLQNLLTERKIVRALEFPQDKNAPIIQIQQLVPASIIVEGGVIAYESNVRTGGIGANFLGVGLSTQYRVDQVTIHLRSVDIRSGQVLSSVSTTKTIYSYEVRPSVFKFVNFKDLVQFEAGVTRNEPTQLCVKEAIESGVVHLIVQGLKDRIWALKDEQDWYGPLIQKYAREDSTYSETESELPATLKDNPVQSPPS